MANYKFGIPEWAMPMNGQYGCRVAHEAGLQGIQINLGDASREWPLSHPEMQKIYLDDRVPLSGGQLPVRCGHDPQTRHQGARGRQALHPLWHRHRRGHEHPHRDAAHLPRQLYRDRRGRGAGL